MLRYVSKRVLEIIPVLLGLSVISFAIIHLAPGDPVKMLLGTRATPEAVSALRTQLGLDGSVLSQYFGFLRGALTFSFGESIQNRLPVTEIIGPRVVPSLLLIGYALALALSISAPAALISARWRDSPVDNGIRLITTASFAMPPFWIGLLLILIGSVRLGWFPSSGYGSTAHEHLVALTLPALTLALGLAAPLIRSLRSTVIENSTAEYVEAAHARGLSEARVLLKHVLRNSLISSVTLVGLMMGALVGATVVIENVFAIPGLGSLMVRSVAARDFPVVQALTLVFGAIVVAASLITDLMYMVIDPRVRQ